MSAAINGPTAQVSYHCLEPAEQEWACAEFPAAILDWGTEKAWDRPNPPQVARTKLAAKTTTRMNLSGIQPIKNAYFAGYTPFEFVILCSNRWLKIEVTVNDGNDVGGYATIRGRSGTQAELDPKANQQKSRNTSFTSAQGLPPFRWSDYAFPNKHVGQVSTDWNSTSCCPSAIICSTLSLPNSQSRFSQPFEDKCIREVVINLVV